jgi:hypothetical protein
MSEERDIIEPAQWQQRDGRREPVLDRNYDLSGVVRYVGWRPCITEGRKFFSRDVAGVRMCLPYKDGRRQRTGKTLSIATASPANN